MPEISQKDLDAEFETWLAQQISDVCLDLGLAAITLLQDAGKLSEEESTTLSELMPPLRVGELIWASLTTRSKDEQNPTASPSETASGTGTSRTSGLG
jgi:hypothetical protein